VDDKAYLDTWKPQGIRLPVGHGCTWKNCPIHEAPKPPALPADPFDLSTAPSVPIKARGNTDTVTRKEYRVVVGGRILLSDLREVEAFAEVDRLIRAAEDLGVAPETLPRVQEQVVVTSTETSGWRAYERPAYLDYLVSDDEQLHAELCEADDCARCDAYYDRQDRY